MKTVNKFIMGSCAVCYVAGLWFLASRFGLFKLLMRYGVSGIFEEIPRTFPEIKYLYYGFGIYTLLFVAAGYVIYAVITRHGKEQDDLQQEAASAADYAERMNGIVSAYRLSVRPDTAAERSVGTNIRKLQRCMASLPPAAVRDSAMSATLDKTIAELQCLLSENCDSESLAAAVDKAVERVEALKRRSIVMK